MPLSQESSSILPIRPLTKGMILNAPSQVIPNEAVLDASNWIVNEIGLKKRPGYAEFGNGSAVVEQVVDIIAMWDTTGEQSIVLLTTDALYVVVPSVGYTRVAWGVVEAANNSTWTGTDLTTTTANVFEFAQAGDEVKFTDSTSGAVTTLYIVSVESHESVTVDQSSAVPHQHGKSTIQYLFSALSRHNKPDWTVVEGLLMVTGLGRPDIAYNPDTNTIGYWITTAGKHIDGVGTVKLVSGCCCYSDERVWVGNTTETGGDGLRVRRIRWSTRADAHDFSTLTAYLDLPYSRGELLRLVPLGNRIIAYFEDGVYIGSPTNYPLMPYRFDKAETGVVGLYGSRGVVSFLGNHFFIGTDDIYQLTDSGIAPVGTPIRRQAFTSGAEYSWNCHASIDILEGCIVFTIPANDPVATRMWRYNFRSKAWSYDDAALRFLGNPLMSDRLTWADLEATWDALPYVSWDEMGIPEGNRYLYLQINGAIWRSSVDGLLDSTGLPVPVTLETKDYDFEGPDTTKTIVRLNIKLDSRLAETLGTALSFQVYGSSDKGRSWKTLGVLTIRNDYDEGYVNFRLTGSTLRFRLVSTSSVHSYTITELGLRTRVIGEELTVALQGAR